MKILQSTITLLLLLVCLNLSFAQVQVSAWEIHKGNEGVIPFNTPDMPARIAAFDQAKIPAKADPGWALAKTKADGTVDYPDLNTFGEKPIECAKQLDFTYFQTFVRIPENSDLTSFMVSYDAANDGARIYILNSDYPNKDFPKGYFDAKGDLILSASKYTAVELKKYIKKGEDNRIVIVQYNQCTSNSITGIRIKVNSKEVKPAVLPTKFKLLAYSLGADRKQEGSNHYLGFDKTKKYNDNTYFVKILTPEDAKDANTTILEFERVDGVDKDGKMMFKATNAPAPNMYLLKADGKEIVLAPGRPDYDRGLFYMRRPEAQEAGNLDAISFESTGFPKTTSLYFMRHESKDVKITEATDAARNTNLYRQDATWLFEPVK